MHNCGLAYHVTNGKHLNLSKSDCMCGCQIGSAAVITLPYDILEGKKEMFYLKATNGLR